MLLKLQEFRRLSIHLYCYSPIFFLKKIHRKFSFVLIHYLSTFVNDMREYHNGK